MALKTLMNEVEFLSQYPMVGLAITDSSGPVPGYLFGEINAITYVDNGSNCKMLVNFLISRLKCDTPIVCIKVLKLLLYLVMNGHSEVVNEVKLHEVTIKEARRFNGPADDIYGNSFYVAIRNMAKELLDLIFSEIIENTPRTSNTDNVGLSGYGSQASSKKMTGFGFTIKTEKTVSDVVSEGFSSFMEKLFPSPDKETRPISHIGDALPRYKPISVDKSPSVGELPATLKSSVHSLPTAPPRVPAKIKEVKEDNLYALIAAVRKIPVLYDFTDADYKQTNKKTSIWAQIAQECGLESGYVARRKWKNLRLQFTRIIKDERTKGHNNTRMDWQYREQMEFLRSYLCRKNTGSKKPETGSNETDDSNESQQPAKKKKKASESTESNDKDLLLCRYLMKKNEEMGKKEPDSLKSFFDHAEKSVRALSKKRQIKAKQMISQLIYKLETEEMEEKEHQGIGATNTQNNYYNYPPQRCCPNMFYVPH